MAKKDSQGALWQESLRAMSLGWNLALPIFGGVLLGHLLDRWLGTRPIFTLGLLTLGIGVGYYSVVHFIQRMKKRIGESAQEESPNSEEVDE